MTFQIFKPRLSAIIFFLMASVGMIAQESQMNALINRSLSKLQQPSQEAYLNCVAELKRIDAMFPDSIQPKYQMALQALSFSVTYPHEKMTEGLLAEAEQTIHLMESMKNADASDVCTLRGFLYMVRIVQDPAANGQRYYLTVIDNYAKALKLNPENQLAKQLQEKFEEGMRRATE